MSIHFIIDRWRLVVILLVVGRNKSERIDARFGEEARVEEVTGTATFGEWRRAAAVGGYGRDYLWRHLVGLC